MNRISIASSIRSYGFYYKPETERPHEVCLENGKITSRFIVLKFSNQGTELLP